LIRKRKSINRSFFLSYNRNDEEYVSPIDATTTKAFGKENVFFDEWPIRPSDSPIRKTNKGKQSTLFFLRFEKQFEWKMISLK